MTTQIEKLSSLHPDIVSDFLDTGESLAIPVEMQLFIMQMQWAMEVWENERNMNRAAKLLKERVMFLQKIRISISTAKKRIGDALQYFDVDEQVAQHVWDRDTANKLEDLAKLAVATNNIREARNCYIEANELKKRANEEAEARDQKGPVFIITNTLTHDDMGFEKENLKKIAAKYNEGFYLNLINNLPVDKEDKKRLRKDADIQDVKFEEIENE